MKKNNKQTEAQTEATNNTSLATTETQEFDHLLAMDKIERSDVDSLPDEKRRQFLELLNSKISAAKDKERDTITERFIALVDPEMLWEVNHAKISASIYNFVAKHGIMPNKTYVAKETGLSRKTIHKHMETMAGSTMARQQKEMAGMMTENVLSKVMQSALKGDMGAAKLYLNTVSGKTGSAGNDIVINNQNNYIQINNTVLNQQLIQQLKPEQLQQIEDLIKSILAENKG